MLDENGNMPDIQKPFLVDAIGTCVGACTGNTTITTFVESTSGVEAGGRTGLTSVVVAILFALMVFFSPLVLMIPDAATGPALIFVGFLMVSGIQNIDFSDFTDAFGPFVMIMFVIFAGGIAAGIAAGILAHIFIKLATGKYKELSSGYVCAGDPAGHVLYFQLMKTKGRLGRMMKIRPKIQAAASQSSPGRDPQAIWPSRMCSWSM